MTEYLVFRRTSVAEGTPVFQLVGKASAHDAKSAIAAAIGSSDDPSSLDGETFAACPAKGWRSETVTVKTETKVTVG